ncbi:MAG: sigma-70 family RNA polymerase sigma factor [Prevotellaceae bacterium]|jgi:RNA polymerase sigma-70 factor (ECF subfamily)|nr:sigma-70 family RNA polymerase sigma factor [Prevotellaceae bacterium]
MDEVFEKNCIDRTLRGDHAAFAALVNAHKDDVFTLVFRIVRQRGQAEELAQDVFLKAFKHLSSFRHKAKFSTWLYRIAFNTAISATRKQALPEYPIAEAVLQVSDEPDDTSRHRQLQALAAALGQLPPADVALVTLFYTENRSMEEICGITGLSLPNAKVRLHRIRHKLREQLIKQPLDDE